MQKSTVDTGKKTIQEIFASGTRLIVPKYQRPFAWEVDDAERFYEDIFSSKNEDYFLGSILLSRKNDGVLEIVDGQQRVTASSLFLTALYLVAKETSKDDAAAIRIYFQNNVEELFKKSPVIQLSNANNDFYLKLINATSIKEVELINSTAETDSNKNLLKILKSFIKKLEKEKSQDLNIENKRISEIFKHFATKVFYITITTEDNRDASKLFEVLNKRGVDLTEADLIRNALLSKAEQEGFVDSIFVWEGIEAKIGVDNLDQFLRYASWLFSKKTSAYDRVFDFIEGKSSKTLIDYLSELSDFYLQIIDPTNYSDSDVSRYLEELNILGVTQVRTILLAANKTANKSEFIELLAYLVKFIFCYSTICGRNPNKIESISSTIAYGFANEKLSIPEAIKKIQELKPDKEDFKNAFLNKKFTSNKIPRYILEKIEASISSNEKKQILLLFI